MEDGEGYNGSSPAGRCAKILPQPTVFFDILAENDVQVRDRKINSINVVTENTPDESGAGSTDSQRDSSTLGELSSFSNVGDVVGLLQQLAGEHFLDKKRVKIVRKLGEGGFAKVELAKLRKDKGDPELVAIKTLRPGVIEDDTDLKELIQEANLLRKLEHRYVVNFKGIGCFKSGSVDDMRTSVFFGEEYMAGGSLKQILVSQMRDKHKRVYRMEDAWRWCMQMAEALDYLHNCKPVVVHRDLKPENVLLTSADMFAAEARIADFGLHKRINRVEKRRQAKTASYRHILARANGAQQPAPQEPVLPDDKDSPTHDGDPPPGPVKKKVTWSDLSEVDKPPAPDSAVPPFSKPPLALDVSGAKGGPWGAFRAPLTHSRSLDVVPEDGPAPVCLSDVDAILPCPVTVLSSSEPSPVTVVTALDPDTRSVSDMADEVDSMTDRDNTVQSLEDDADGYINDDEFVGGGAKSGGSFSSCASSGSLELRVHGGLVGEFIGGDSFLEGPTTGVVGIDTDGRMDVGVADYSDMPPSPFAREAKGPSFATSAGQQPSQEIPSVGTSGSGTQFDDGGGAHADAGSEIEPQRDVGRSVGKPPRPDSKVGGSSRRRLEMVVDSIKIMPLVRRKQSKSTSEKKGPGLEKKQHGSSRALDQLVQGNNDEGPLQDAGEVGGEGVTDWSIEFNAQYDKGFSLGLSGSSIITGMVGSLMYMAPEVVLAKEYDEKVDVFGFGLIMYELFVSRLTIVKVLFGAATHTDMEKNLHAHAQKVAHGHREKLPGSWPAPLKDLISDCWSEEPSDRPPMAEVRERLKQLRLQGVIDALDKDLAENRKVKKRDVCCACCVVS